VLGVVAILVICGFTLYWTQAEMQTMSARVDGMDRSLQALREQASTQVLVASGPAASQGSSVTTSTVPQSSRLAHIVKCDIAGNQVTVAYDPAQLLTGTDAVDLAASRGEAVTGGNYIFDPNHDLFTGDAPIKAGVVVHQPPAGWTAATPATITDLAAALQSAQGKQWQGLYFWLRFNGGFIVAVEQYQVGDSQE
jgi:hypothetical protein